VPTRLPKLSSIISQNGNVTELRSLLIVSWPWTTHTAQNSLGGGVIKVLRDLEGIALGQLIEGRHGHKSRFKWALGIEMVSVGRVASGEAPMTEDELPVEDEDVDEPVTEAESTDQLSSRPPAAAVGTLEHIFQLRRDFTVRLLLPETLTPTEAARLAEFIKTLPFG
jgi:hypothetical protein